MGIFDSLWEGVEDFGTTAYEGIKDLGSTVNRLYEDDFLKKLESGVTEFYEGAEDLVHTEEYQGAAKAALAYWAGGGEGWGGEANSLWGAEGSSGFFGTEGTPDWLTSMQDMSSMSGGVGGQQAPAQQNLGQSYSGLIGRLNSLIGNQTQQINPYEEIVIPSGARY